MGRIEPIGMLKSLPMRRAGWKNCGARVKGQTLLNSLWCFLIQLNLSKKSLGL
jgi:hypothetical protein